MVSELTINGLVELKKEFEDSLGASVGTRLANFRKKTEGRARISSIDIRFVDLMSGFPSKFIDQAVSDVTCSVKVIDDAGNTHEL